MWEEGFRFFSYDTRIDPWAFWCILCLAVLILISYCILWSPKKHFHDFIVFLLAEYIVAVLLVTVFLRKTLAVPEGFEQSLFGNKSFLVENYYNELLVNILLFVPIGFLIYVVLKKYRVLMTLVLGVAFSFVIEILQFILQKGVADIDDIICNSMGLLIGMVTCVIAGFAFRRCRLFPSCLHVMGYYYRFPIWHRDK